MDREAIPRLPYDTFFRYILYGGLFCIAIFLLLVVSWKEAPAEFPIHQPVVIQPGRTATEIVAELQRADVVRSEVLLYITLLLFHNPADVKAGTYSFEEPVSVFAVADRITGVAPPGDLITLTFPEGISVEDFSIISSSTLPLFDAATFNQLASTSEGYLFPDTYYIPEDFAAADLYALLRKTHESKTRHINTLSYDAVILASIVEREANTPDSMRLVAGILLSRLGLGMPLQVDATMEYILSTPLNELAPGELAQNIRELDSPYNTYLNPGLPPTPIGNPGLTALEAVLNPKDSPYLFYITGDDGNFYYAETFAEHKENIARYLR